MELTGGNLRIIFARDRYYEDGPIAIMVASVNDEQGPGNWYVDFALHQVMWLALAAEHGKYPSNAEMAHFLRTNMSKVQSMFSISNLKDTKAARDKLTAEWLRKAEKAADRARRGRRLT